MNEFDLSTWRVQWKTTISQLRLQSSILKITWLSSTTNSLQDCVNFIIVQLIRGIEYRFGPFMFYLLLVYHQSLKFQIWLDTSNNVFTLNIKFEIWKDIKISHCTNTSVDELVLNSFLHVSILMGINQNRWIYKNINWKTNSCFTYIHDVYERNSL